MNRDWKGFPEAQGGEEGSGHHSWKSSGWEGAELEPGLGGAHTSHPTSSREPRRAAGRMAMP